MESFYAPLHARDLPSMGDIDISLYLLCREIKKTHTVAVSGESADEVFGGYPSYRYHASAAAYRTLPVALRGMVRAAVRTVNGAGGDFGRRVRRFVEESELPVDLAWQHSRSAFTDTELELLYAPSFAGQVQTCERGSHVRESYKYFASSSAGDAVINYVDYETYLPGDILVKVDRMSMANSLELRAPLLDYRIAEFAAGLPRHWKWTPWEGKRILRRAAATVLPREVLTRRKQGFVAPIKSWFRGELKPFLRDVLHSSRAGHVIRTDYCEQLLERHSAGEAGIIERKLWSVFCYLLWHDKFSS